MIAAQYQKLAILVDALELRERVLLLIGSIVLLFFLVDRIGFQPAIQKQQLLLQGIKDQELQLDVLRAQFSQFYEEPVEEQPNTLALLHTELGSSNQNLQLQLDRMLSPDKATSILEQVMSHEEGLTLNAVNTRMTPLTSIDADTRYSQATNKINRYELELQLEGGYLETLDYLRALEALPWKFFWTGINFATTEHPKGNVELEIYTLGQAEY